MNKHRLMRMANAFSLTTPSNNYVSAFFLISAGMALHYELILEKYGMCPLPVAVGPKNTGKSTAARTALALLEHLSSLSGNLPQLRHQS